MFARDQQATAQTDKSLVAAPGANRQIKVTGLIISTTAANVVTIESATANQRLQFYPGANGTITVFDPDGLFHCVANEALTYTTTAATPFFIEARYEIVRGVGA